MQWEKFSNEEKINFTKTLFNYVKSQMKSILAETEFLKGKVAALITHILKREWPQLMPSLLNNVFELSKNGVCFGKMFFN